VQAADITAVEDITDITHINEPGPAAAGAVEQEPEPVPEPVPEPEPVAESAAEDIHVSGSL
jgi:hypothetical protein